MNTDRSIALSRRPTVASLRDDQVFVRFKILSIDA